MTEIIWNREGWVVTLEDYRGVIDTYVYRITPPKWSVRFDVAGNGVPGGETLEVQANAKRMERALIEAILDDTRVKAVLQERLARAEWEGYVGSKQEDRNRTPYEFKYRNR